MGVGMIFDRGIDLRNSLFGQIRVAVDKATPKTLDDAVVGVMSGTCTAIRGGVDSSLTVGRFVELGLIYRTTVDAEGGGNRPGPVETFLGSAPT
jgi:hypothetical protein